MSLSNSAENLVYDWLYRPGQSPTRPAGLFVALYTAVTDAEAGTGTEVSGGSYARVNVGTAFGAPTDGAGSNSSIITFAAPTANWGTVTHFAIRDASTGGNAVSAIVALTASRVINNGDAAPQFAVGALTLSIS
jgi:hypothetical protein